MEKHINVCLELGQYRVFFEVISFGVSLYQCQNSIIVCTDRIQSILSVASERCLHKTTFPLSLFPPPLSLSLSLSTEYTVNRYRLYTHSRIHCNPTRRRSQPNWWWAAVSQWNS